MSLGAPVVAASPTEAPARGQRVYPPAQQWAVDNKERLLDLMTSDKWRVVREAFEAGQAHSIATQAERIATLERERDEARKLKVAWFEAAQSFADRATIAEARITDLTRQLAEAKREGMERRSRRSPLLSAVESFVNANQQTKVKDVLGNLSCDGPAEVKQLMNCLGYLTRKGLIRRVRYGVYEPIRAAMPAAAAKDEVR